MFIGLFLVWRGQHLLFAEKPPQYLCAINFLMIIRLLWDAG
jgi:hypothetical protein